MLPNKPMVSTCLNFDLTVCTKLLLKDYNDVIVIMPTLFIYFNNVIGH